MIDLLAERFVQCGYKQVQVPYKELKLFYTVSNNICYAVNVIDYREAGASPVNSEFLREFNKSCMNYFENRGMSNVRMLAIVGTYSEDIAAQLVGKIMPYWVLNTYQNELVFLAGDEGFATVKKVLENMDSPKKSGSYKNRLVNFNNLIVLINIVVFAILESIGSTSNIYFMLDHGGFYWPSVSEDGEIYRFLTSMFLHFGFDHLFSNMIVLYFLGDNLERAIGGKKHVMIYLLSGLAATCVSCIYYVYVDMDVVSCGASGAIFGVVGALLYIVWKNDGHLEDLSVFRLLLFVGFSFYSGFTSTGIDNAAHVGGFVAGIILAAIWYRARRKDAKEETLRQTVD